MNPRDPLYFWLVLLTTPNLPDKTISQLIVDFPHLDALLSQTALSLTKKYGFKESILPALKNPDKKNIERGLKWCEHPNHYLLGMNDPRYPQRLKEISSPPPFLFLSGNIDTLSQNSLAIVGSRRASKPGLETAFQFSKALAEAGLTITSGLALGIDTASHQGALAVKAHTVAVLATGVDQIYPRQNQKLAQKILENGGALVSEFFIDTPPKAGNFPRRNRIISGLSLGVLVVEAAEKSGSLITARFALEQNREVFAIPHSIHNPFGKGCHALLKQGAKLVEHLDDILEELRLDDHRTKTQKNPKIANAPQIRLDDNQKQLLDCLGFEPTPIDILIERSKLAADQVVANLLSLEIENYVSNTSLGFIKHVRSTKE